MSEDSYTIKELVQELRGETKAQSTILTRICANLESVEKHLAQLNSKVAAHELLHGEIDKRFGGLEKFQTKAMLVYSFCVFIVSSVAIKLLSSINF